METHSYPPRRQWWRSDWITAPVWLGIAIFSGAWAYLLFPLVSVVGRRLAGRWGRSDAANLVLSAEGLKVFGVEMPWSNVVRIESVQGSRRGRDVMVLDRGIVWSHGGRGGRALRGIDLTRFDPNWRSGPIGDDLRHWAPHLLSDSNTLISA